ncbi:hypothetical protein [Salinivibrio kushneri]|uniref:hypothetical protein n=1 Tax=Salinivibrio kushneri TaxID=1908198 RepID=UPI001301974C|nr:hypothetical protein [Salinivibrio kushneri]
MKFHVIETSERIPLTAQTVAYLRKENWNEFSFQTLFRLEVVEKKNKIDIGLVEIAFREQTTTTPTYHKLNDTFTELTNDFFSLGEGYKIICSQPDVNCS